MARANDTRLTRFCIAQTANLHCFIDGDRQCLTQTFVPKPAKPIPVAAIERRIHLICGNKVMLDANLAKLYGVATKESE
jgi:hypothetical protein